MKIVYGGLKVTDQVATLINYGTLVFESTLASYPKTPWGDPPIAETGAWKSLENYGTHTPLFFLYHIFIYILILTVRPLGDIVLQVDNSPIGVSLYNDIRTWNWKSGKVTLKMVQESTANDRGIFDSNYEYNDAISSGGQHDYYEADLNGDVHFVFAQVDVNPGETAKP